MSLLMPLVHPTAQQQAPMHVVSDVAQSVPNPRDSPPAELQLATVSSMHVPSDMQQAWKHSAVEQSVLIPRGRPPRLWHRGGMEFTHEPSGRQQA
jgi:hypothetical protein